MKKITFFLWAIVSLAGCSTHKSESNIEGHWIMTDYSNVYISSFNLTPVDSIASYTLRFHDTGHFSFTTDCNTLSGDYAVNGDSIRFIDIAATEIACENEIVERSVKTFLPAVATFSQPTDSTLWLEDNGGRPLFKFSKLSNLER